MFTVYREAYTTMQSNITMRVRLILLMVLSFAACNTGCKPANNSPGNPPGAPPGKPSPTPTPTVFQLKGNGDSYVEITAVASPPLGGNGPCKDGMILAGAGDGRPRLLMGSLLSPPASYDLAENDGFKWIKTGSIEPPPEVATEAAIGSDNQTALAANGDLLIMWNGSTKAPLANGPSLSWWNDWGTPGNTVSPNFGFMFPDGKRNGFRGALVLWRYSCSQGKWLATNILDAGKDKALDKNNTPQAGYNAYWAPYAGFDREELYLDPWGVDPKDTSKQRIFVTTRVERPGDRTWQLFTSPDTGATWNPGIRFLDRAPVAMTSTASGRLFFLQPSGNSRKPVLQWSDDHGHTLNSPAGGYDITYVNPAITFFQNFPMGQLDSDTIGVGQPAMGTLSLAPAGYKGVLAVYPAVQEVTVNNKKIKVQVAAVVYVGTGDKDGNDAGPFVVPVKIIRAQDPAGSVTMANFVQDNRPTSDINYVSTNMLYWLETGPVPAHDTEPIKMTARYLMFVGVKPDTAQTLSDPAEWEENNRKGYKALGDYMKGSFFAYNGNMNFLAVWPEVPATSPAKNTTQAYIRIITFPDGAKPAPPPMSPEIMPGSRKAPLAVAMSTKTP
jgi:hypothetical protein